MITPKFTLREISPAETIARWNNRNTHSFLNIDPRYLSGRRGFVCGNPSCEGLYRLKSINMAYLLIFKPAQKILLDTVIP